METPFHNDPLEYQIETKEDGTRVATNPLTTLSIMPDGETKLFKRRAIKTTTGKETEFDTVLIGELDGVRVYVKNGAIVLTKQDLYL